MFWFINRFNQFYRRKFPRSCKRGWISKLVHWRSLYTYFKRSGKLKKINKNFLKSIFSYQSAPKKRCLKLLLRGLAMTRKLGKSTCQVYSNMSECHCYPKVKKIQIYQKKSENLRNNFFKLFFFQITWLKKWTKIRWWKIRIVNARTWSSRPCPTT